jgi:hypothetical protein
VLEYLKVFGQVGFFSLVFRACWPVFAQRRSIMDMTTLIILVVVVLFLFGGGGGYHYSRRRL